MSTYSFAADLAATTYDPLELYASGIDTSDYVAKVATLLRDLVPDIGDLLDVGAGGGQLGAAMRKRGRLWAAIEPSPTMQRRLRAFADGPTIESSGWTEAQAPGRGFDTVMAANMPAPLTDAPAFLARCRSWSRRTVAWVVPAQNGPRGLCLAGCLPAEWHGESEVPGVDLVMDRLDVADRPDASLRTRWSFRLTVPSIPGIATYLADRLGWAADDARRPDLVSHLAAAAEPVPGGFRLTVPRESAVLVWGVS